MPKMKRLLPLLLVAPFATSCQTVVSTPPSNCYAFVPPAWWEGTPSYPVPLNDDALSWQKFGVGQSGQLAKSDGKVKDIGHIWKECERRQLEARPRKNLLGIF